MKKEEKTYKTASNKWRGGRPKLSEKEKRSHPIWVYFSEKEKEQVEVLLAKSNYKNLSTLVRDALLTDKVKIYYEDKTRQDIVYHLAKIGTNINQIAHRLNADQAPRLGQKDLKILIELRELFDKIRF